MKKTIIFIPILISLLIFWSCSPQEAKHAQTPVKKVSLANNNSAMLDGLTAIEALEFANKWKTSNPNITSYITADSLIIQFQDKNKIEIPLPQDSMMIAIAPYVENTHTCATHFISGCQGELTDVPVKVLAVKDDGTVLIDSTMITMSNGFIELWLPRDINFTLTIESMNRRAKEILTTFSDSNTCITTMQLL